jgi:nucleotide-binding universal stress UspA family protein
MNIRKILFPVDFSERCDGAARYVEAYARRFQSEVTMIHCVNRADYLFGVGEFGGYQIRDQYQAHIEAAKRRLDSYLANQFEGHATRRLVIEGDPAAKIVEFAHDDGTGFIMMPSHGMGPFRRHILGSVTAKVLHDADCVVWTGAHLELAPPLPIIGFEKAVCAVDLGEQSEGALRWASCFAKAAGGSVVIAHAVPAIETRPEKYLDTEFFGALCHQAAEQIAALQKRAGTDLPVRIKGGEPARVVHEVASDEAADVVVIARGSAGGGAGRLRTHAYAIIRNSPVPVISV